MSESTASAGASADASTVPVLRAGETDHDIHPLIAGRWSPRAISERPVDPEAVRRVLEAARWAPSSFNEQPWRFLVATADEPEWIERLRGYLTEGNAWALRAPVLVASAWSTTFARNGRRNRMAHRDLGAAEQNAFLQAAALGLAMHQMAGFDHEALQRELLPDGFEPGSMWAIGHPGDPAALPEGKRRDRAERGRRPLRETVFGPDWDEPAAVVASTPPV